MRSSLWMEFDANSMGSNLPVQIVIAIFKMTEDRDRDMKLGQLIESDWGKSWVLKCTVGTRYKLFFSWQFINRWDPYLTMAYSFKPQCRFIGLNVPMHPLKRFSLPTSQVTNKGLWLDKEICMNKVELCLELQLCTAHHWWIVVAWVGPTGVDDCTTHQSNRTPCVGEQCDFCRTCFGLNHWTAWEFGQCSQELLWRRPAQSLRLDDPSFHWVTTSFFSLWSHNIQLPFQSAYVFPPLPH